MIIPGVLRATEKLQISIVSNTLALGKSRCDKLCCCVGMHRRQCLEQLFVCWRERTLVSVAVRDRGSVEKGESVRSGGGRQRLALRKKIATFSCSRVLRNNLKNSIIVNSYLFCYFDIV